MNLVDLVASFESFSPRAYADPPGSGKSSIGYGHQILLPNELYLTTATIDEPTGQSMLEVDLRWYAHCVDSCIGEAMTENQSAAMTSLCYNIGCEAFQKSTVVARFNAGDLEGAADAFLLWDIETMNGREITSTALRARRQKEREVFLT